jgi:radical SAM protein with 4Fe4S-binding SPASM domain
MRAKLTVTTRCGAKCATCPVWKGPHQTMTYDQFVRAFDALNESPLIDEIFLNGTGDLYSIDSHIRYLIYVETNQKKRVTITTNGNVLDFVPRVNHLTISFNGSNKENYEATTGLDFGRVVENIRDAYGQIEKCGYREIDCLVWQGNKGCEAEFLDLWKDFPGVRRISYKVENQFGAYFGLPEHKDENRIFCDYLDAVTIMPSGQFVRCAHDFKSVDNYGNIFENDIKLAVMHPARKALREAHKRGLYPGICEKCNYNVRAEGKLVYVRQDRRLSAG